ncbi:MAG: adenylate/guanylate cyclase domain-containing protein [Planctomycetota bacterium]
MNHISTSHHPDHAALKRLLAERNQFPERAHEIDASIRKSFERTIAILNLDMCGFSRLTAKHGIIHYMAMIYQMEQAAVPAVLGNGGTVIKQEADNLYAIFPDPVHALEGALDIFRAFAAMNAVLPDDRAIYGSVGIGFGDTLIIDHDDMFGNEMNLACKLGEDLAEKMEILLTPAAFAMLPVDHYVFKPKSFAISGMEMCCHAFEKSLFPDLDGDTAAVGV